MAKTKTEHVDLAKVLVDPKILAACEADMPDQDTLVLKLPGTNLALTYKRWLRGWTPQVRVLVGRAGEKPVVFYSGFEISEAAQKFWDMWVRRVIAREEARQDDVRTAAVEALTAMASASEAEAE